MMNSTAIKVQNLTKIYKLYDRPVDRLKESLSVFGKKYHKDFYALKDLSFEVMKGQTIGILGKNGAGKSTLLKVITGVLTPSSGDVFVNGRIASLLELGAGFNPDYTGVENIYLQGSLMGISHSDMEKRIDEITKFADIGDFIFQPVKVYSSGMFARLAFAVAINVDPDILIIDEALSVGDVRFQQKCYRRFKKFQDEGKTILFVTHDVSTIVNYCTRVIWMSEGGILDQGDPQSVSHRYSSMMHYEQETAYQNDESEIHESLIQNDDIKWISTKEFESFGDRDVLISHVSLVQKKDQLSSVFEGGEQVSLMLKMFAKKDIDDLIAGFTVYDELGNSIFGSNTFLHDFGKLSFKSQGEYIVSFDFDIPLIKNGSYSISPAIAQGIQSEHIQQHWVHNAVIFKINARDSEAEMGWLLRHKDIKIEVV